MRKFLYNSNIDFRNQPPRHFTQQSPQKPTKKQFDYQLLNSNNSRASSVTQIRQDAPVTIKGNNFTYKGFMNGNQKEGLGQYYDANNQIEYDGEWKNGKQHGLGRQFQNGKLHYQGNFENGIKEGAGMEYYDDGSYFVGNFKNNIKCGMGSLIRKDQTIYGFWLDDKLIEKF